jgi:Sec-independent protein translocase protein TatA
MPMTRSGLSSLMGYAPGGGVDLADIEDANEIINSESSNEVSSDIGDQSAGIAGLTQEELLKEFNKMQGGEGDVTSQFLQYRKMLNEIMPPRPRLTGYDLAGALAKGIFASQSEKIPSLGKGVGLGFLEFNKLQKEIDEANRKDKQSRDLTAFGMVTKKKGSESAKQGGYWKDDKDEFFRELLIGTELVFKGEGKVMNEQEFFAQHPDARPYVASEASNYIMDLKEFMKQSKVVRENEQSLDALASYIKTFDDANVGFSRIATDVENFFNTIFATEGISPAALAQGLQEGKFQALIGRFREEVVGPGIMTEFDAGRIIAALGSEPSALQNPYRMKAILKDVFEQKVGVYEDALKLYNLGAGSGNFEGYQKKDTKTWDMSMFDSPLTVPEGATIVEEVTNAQDKPVAVIYTKNGKTYRRNLNGTIQEIKDASKVPSKTDDILEDI